MKSLYAFLFAISVASVAMLTSCDLPIGKIDTVVVSVGDTRLYESDVRRMVPEWDSWNDHEKLTFLEHWIDEETIYQEAVDHGALKDTALQNQIEQTIRKMTVDHFLQAYMDTMMVGDAERLDYYKNHPEFFLRGRTMVSGAVLTFRDWQSADLYYKGHKAITYEAMPNVHYLIKSIDTFDSVTTSPDKCMIPSIKEPEVGKLSMIKACGGALKLSVIVSRLDSADVLPYAEVVDDVASRVWVEHQKTVMDRLKKQWKNSRPIFSKMNVFGEKEK